ncbi:hypothetical protein GCM10009765_55570 [Fodinicola feengrottensis]|uniref:Uncharacterized protein n=1 Tax=Fodinicola feengrottensis TaxID=435914 RepID=A0ABP4U8K2_9ACTN
MVGDQPGGLEHFEVLGDRWSADRQGVGEFADGLWSFGQARDDESSAWIAEYVPSVKSSVSSHKR